MEAKMPVQMLTGVVAAQPYSQPVVLSSEEAAEEYFLQGAQHFMDGKCEPLLYQNVPAYATGWHTAQELERHRLVRMLEQAITRGAVTIPPASPQSAP